MGLGGNCVLVAAVHKPNSPSLIIAICSNHLQLFAMLVCYVGIQHGLRCSYFTVNGKLSCNNLWFDMLVFMQHVTKQAQG